MRSTTRPLKRQALTLPKVLGDLIDAAWDFVGSCITVVILVFVALNAIRVWL